MNVKILSNEDVNHLVKMEDAIDIIRSAFIQLHQGKADLPLRIQIQVTQQTRTLVMPAYLKETGALATKIISIFPENRGTDLPTVHAVVMVTDSRTGQPLALMGAHSLTALRTGAASGVATELLARKDSRVVAIFGAGIQGRTQLQAVCCVRPIEKVLIYDVDPTAVQTYIEDMRTLPHIPPNIQPASSPSHALEVADIVCTATPSTQPVFQDEFLKRGTHINAIGSFTPHMQEIPEKTVARSKIVVDSLEASLSESGDLIIPLNHTSITREDIHGELGELASGARVGRETDDEITLFKSVGLAIQDAALSHYVLTQAQSSNRGCNVKI
ncbi:MAG: hypothetical protein HXS47_10020 [Theionarchaea archaeon]|nr:hypothetical protein [Theionarchaea archaeon]